MPKGIHHQDDVDILYVSRKEEESGLARIQVSFDASIK